MNGDYLSALALLKTSYDEHGTTYVDYMVPFVGDTIRASGATSMPSAALKAALLDRYGLDVPDSVLNTLTRRLARAGYGRRDHGEFQADQRKLEASFDFEERRSSTQKSISALAESFVHFVATELDRTLSVPEATAALTAYAERNGLPILRRAMQNQKLATSLSLDDLEYLSSRFVIHVFENSLPERETLVVLAKGSKLASVLYLPNPGEAGRKFDDLLALFDTPTILSALGYQGKEAESATREVLDLAYANGLKLGVFEHTMQEVESVLDAVGHQVGRRGFGGRQLRGVEPHFLSLGYNASDIKLLAAHLQEDVESLRIRVIRRPRMQIELSIDETAFEEYLLQSVHYQRREPMRHDLEAITATYRLRHGDLPSTFERSKAIFVSPNVALVRASASFFTKEFGKQWPLGITEDDFATLLWLKRPLAAPDLPTHRLLADAYSALDPGMVNWANYLDEIDRLKSRGEVNDDQYFFLRYATEARQALMEERLGEDTAVSAETINRVIERVRNQLSKPGEVAKTRLASEHARALKTEQQEKEALRLELETTRAESLTARSEAARARSDVDRLLDSQRRAARRRAQRTAQLCRFGLTGAFVLILATGLWFSAPAAWNLPPLHPPWAIRWTARAAVLALLLLTLGNLVFGWQANELSRRAELRIAGRLERRHLARAGLDIDNDQRA